MMSPPNCNHKFCLKCAERIIYIEKRCPQCIEELTINIQPNPAELHPAESHPPELPPAELPPENIVSLPLRAEARVNNMNEIPKANEILDQCCFFQYVIESFSRKKQEQDEILQKAYNDIEINYDLASKRLHEAMQEQLTIIRKINQENQEYYTKIIAEIQGLIDRRIQLKQEIGIKFTNNSFISKQDQKEFYSFSYPKFSFQLTTATLNFIEKKVVGRARKMLGFIDINWNKKDLRYSNNSDFNSYKKQRGSENNIYLNQQNAHRNSPV